MSRPLERQYFILDSKEGMLSIFQSLRQVKPTERVCMCQCLMSLTTEYSIVNIDLQKKFEVQPMSREQVPAGDLLQISVPNNTSFAQFQILV